MAFQLFTPKYRSYSCCNDRVKSYEDWPKYHHPSPAQHSKSGFFYMNRGDRVRCFYCGIVLKDWNIMDIPNTRHKKESKDCKFLKMIVNDDDESNDFPVNLKSYDEIDLNKIL